MKTDGLTKNRLERPMGGSLFALPLCGTVNGGFDAQVDIPAGSRRCGMQSFPSASPVEALGVGSLDPLDG
jgi:hypothetical protein